MIGKTRTGKAETPKTTKASDAPALQGHTWTQGDRFKTIGGTALIGALLLCGPLALGVAFSGANQETVAVAEQQQAGLSPDQQAAGGRAVEFVGAWLSATDDDHGQFDQFDVANPQNFSKIPTVFSDLHLVSVVPEPKSGSNLRVTVGAAVKETIEGAATIQQRHFVVPVKIVDGVPVIASLPAPASIPVNSSTSLSTDYSQQVQGPALESVRLFFDAYLTGQGDLARMLTPGSPIQPLTPAPYAKVTIIDMRAVEAPSKEPRDGETANVIVQLNAARPGQADIGQPATFTLALTARASRWEVTSISDFPILNESLKPTPDTTPETE